MPPYTKTLIQNSRQVLAEVERSLECLNVKRMELGEFFCEDTKTFKLEECFKIFSIFITRFHKAVQA